MRLFIAIELPKEVKDHLFNLKKKVKEAKVIWVHKKNLHLTLKFLGDINENKLEEIKTALSSIISKPIDAKLGKFGTFSTNGKIRVLWVSVEPEKEIIQLQQNIDGELLTIAPSEIKFQSHVTLGRVKAIRKQKEFKNSLKELEIKPIKFKIEKFHLIKSEITSSGPRYKILETYSL